MMQFAVGYFVMLLAMYYNGTSVKKVIGGSTLTTTTMVSGYMIICIFIGAFLGASVFQWDTYHAVEEYVFILFSMRSLGIYLTV